MYNDGKKDRGIVIKFAHGWRARVASHNWPRQPTNAVAFRQRHRIDCLNRLYHNSTTSGSKYRGG